MMGRTTFIAANAFTCSVNWSVHLLNLDNQEKNSINSRENICVTVLSLFHCVSICDITTSNSIVND